MSKKLFVGGLSWNTDNDGLHAAFEKYGAVEEAVVIYDRDTGRSRGFGFVTFGENSDALDAIDAMNDTTLDGRTIRVNEAQERRRGGGGGGGRRYGGGQGGRDRSRGGGGGYGGSGGGGGGYSNY